MKIGLVLEGGGMRALFSAGVLDAFLDENIEVDGIVSVSAGALFGVNFVSKQKERAVRYNEKFAGDKRYMSFSSWLKTGNVVSKDFAFYEIPFKRDVFDQKEFEKSKIDFYVVLTNVETGKAEYVLIKDVFKQMEYFRATSALPFASKIIKINGKKYLDGGIVDPIPFEFLQKQNYDKIILILTRPKDKLRDANLNFLFKLVYKNYPRLVARLVNMNKDYEEILKKIKKLENKKEIFVIRPDEVLKIGKLETDKKKIREIYEIGYKKGKSEIKKLKEYLEKI